MTFSPKLHNISWPAVSAIASATASLATLGIVWLTYLQLGSMLDNNTAARRNDAVKDLAAGIQRFKDDPDDGAYLIQVLNNIAASQRANILTSNDIEFVSNYLSRDGYLRGNVRLCKEWRNTAARTPELTKLVETALNTQECTKGQ